MDSAVGQVDESLNSIRTEWNVLKQKWFFGETLDPVFEGMVKDFCVFDVTMQDIYSKVDVFMKGVDNLSEGLVTLSGAVTGGLVHVDDPLIASDSCKFKEATNQISRADAPHSAIAKIRRDMDFNIMNPVRLHLINNRNLKAHLDKRRRKLLELNTTKKHFDDVSKKDVSKTDKKYLVAQANLDAAKMAFHEVDRHVFEWLYILEEYRGDILDSTLQTLKYLQYEFFATAAHAISGVLPARMEFRPMVEMTPDHLSTQVEMELEEAEVAEDEKEPVTDFSKRLIEKMSKDNKAKPGDGLDSSANDPGPALPVDPLSLSSLLSQGFDEGPARRALRLHQNNTQAALDWLIDGGADAAEGSTHKNMPEDGVRMPTTIKRIQKLKAIRRAKQEKLKRQEAAAESEDSSEEASVAPQASPSTENKPPQTSEISNLLDFDEPPPPTDFTKQVNVLELPVMMSFEAESNQAKATAAQGSSQPLQNGQTLQPPAAGANAALQLLQQAQISPEQLLQAAQQIIAAQQGVQAPSPAATPAVASLLSAPTAAPMLTPAAPQLSTPAADPLLSAPTADPLLSMPTTAAPALMTVAPQSAPTVAPLLGAPPLVPAASQASASPSPWDDLFQFNGVSASSDGASATTSGGPALSLSSGNSPSLMPTTESKKAGPASVFDALNPLQLS